MQRGIVHPVTAQMTLLGLLMFCQDLPRTVGTRFADMVGGLEQARGMINRAMTKIQATPRDGSPPSSSPSSRWWVMTDARRHRANTIRKPWSHEALAISAHFADPHASISFLLLAMTSLISSLTNTKKVNDLSHNTIEATPKTGLTTDHGVSISNTDDWYVIVRISHSYSLHRTTTF